jgi:hypothetical protein
MGVDHRRPNVAMAEEFLHRSNVVSAGQQVCRERRQVDHFGAASQEPEDHRNEEPGETLTLDHILRFIDCLPPAGPSLSGSIESGVNHQSIDVARHPGKSRRTQKKPRERPTILEESSSVFPPRDLPGRGTLGSDSQGQDGQAFVACGIRIGRALLATTYRRGAPAATRNLSCLKTPDPPTGLTAVLHVIVSA